MKKINFVDEKDFELFPLKIKKFERGDEKDKKYFLFDTGKNISYFNSFILNFNNNQKKLKYVLYASTDKNAKFLEKNNSIQFCKIGEKYWKKISEGMWMSENGQRILPL